MTLDIEKWRREFEASFEEYPIKWSMQQTNDGTGYRSIVTDRAWAAWQAAKCTALPDAALEDSQVRAWLERHNMEMQFSIHDARIMIDDARSMHLIAAGIEKDVV